MFYHCPIIFPIIFSHHFPHGFTIRWVHRRSRSKALDLVPKAAGRYKEDGEIIQLNGAGGQSMMVRWWIRWLVCKGNDHNSWKYHWDIYWDMMDNDISDLWEN
jgi:hypothetical protein